jgi:DNA modification methylase
LETGKPSIFSTVARRSIFSKVGGTADHFTRYGSTQWELCTPETYDKLTDLFNLREWDGYREYEDLRREYEDLRYTHNLDANHNNVWHSSEHNDGSVHACKKPTDLLRRIVITSSREGATVLDCFMGSGSTGVACAETNRKFIGIEKDPKTFNAAAQRIDAAEAQIRLCGI